MHRILLTCPPMIGQKDCFTADFKAADFDIFVPDFTQEMTEEQLIEIIPEFDGWIIGDDPVTNKVISAGKNGRLKACMRWGVGTDNVDFAACEAHGIPIENTPGVFGREVADLAMHYVSALARHSFEIDRQVKTGTWFKPVGTSLWATKALVVGLGDIGKNVVKRLNAHDVDVSYFDPYQTIDQLDCKRAENWNDALSDKDFIIFTAPLTKKTKHMFSFKSLEKIKHGTKIVNVGRGPLINEAALCQGLRQKSIASAALDVFEVEPFSTETHAELLEFSDRIVLGSHNGSNTKEAVEYVSKLCIARLKSFLRD